MPFLAQTPGDFTRAGILRLSGHQMGVYGLYRTGVWIYVGKGDIRERLLAHLGGDNPEITTAGPTNWVAEVTPNMDQRERELIAELGPVCNHQIG